MKETPQNSELTGPLSAAIQAEVFLPYDDNAVDDFDRGGNRCCHCGLGDSSTTALQEVALPDLRIALTQYRAFFQKLMSV